MNIKEDTLASATKKYEKLCEEVGEMEENNEILDR